PQIADTPNGIPRHTRSGLVVPNEGFEFISPGTRRAVWPHIGKSRHTFTRHRRKPGWARENCKNLLRRQLHFRQEAVAHIPDAAGRRWNIDRHGESACASLLGP